MIIWGLWFDGAFWFGTGSKTQKARNLAKNPNCIVGTQNAAEAVILEGIAELILRPSYREEVRANIAQQIWNERG
jgi:general stress protein 26